jgi:hypothetical protein
MWVAWGLLLAAWEGQSANLWPDWLSWQPIEVSTPTFVRVALAPATFDGARADLADLRLTDPAGDEVPYLIERPRSSPPLIQAVPAPRIQVDALQTRIEFEVTNAARVLAIGLDTPAPDFLKAVAVEAAGDNGRFAKIVSGQPIFRQGRASRTFLDLRPLEPTVRRLRVTLDDARSAAVAITGVRLLQETVPPPPPSPVPARILERTEGAEETRLVVDLGAAHLPVVGLRVATMDPLFTRQVSVRSREWASGEVQERLLGGGTIYRVALEGQPVAERLEVPLEFQSGRELVVTIDHGDSPALGVTSLEFLQAPVTLAFLARQAGTHRLFSGNPRATTPRYDFPSVRTPQTTSLLLGGIQTNGDYHPSETLPELSVLGGAFEPSGYAFRRPLQLGGAGVYRLELPDHVLAHTQRGLGDLRLASAGKQVVYLLDRTATTRSVPLEAARIDPKPPSRLSRWKVRLPEAGLPVTRLRCEARTPLFQREIQVFEEVPDRNGQIYPSHLGRATWMRTATRSSPVFEVALSSPPAGDTMIVQTDNGDNAPFELEGFRVLVPVVQILFKVAPDMPVELCYGNPQAVPPQYDLSLVAAQMLAAPKREASLAGGEPARARARPSALPVSGLFYGVLAVVVLGLVLVITRLLPARVKAEEPASKGPG